MPEMRWNPESKGWVDIATRKPRDSVREEAMERSLGYHDNILDHMASGIIAIDLNGKVAAFNRAAEKILGFEADKVLGKDIQMIQGNLAMLILDTLKKGEVYQREEIYILPENILVGVSTSQFHDAKGEMIGAAMVFANLSKVKQDERRERRIEKENFWERLATALAHEIKNSIVAAKTLTQLLPDKYNDQEFRETLCEAVSRDTKKLNEFTERIIAYAQPIKLNLQYHYVHEVVDDILSCVAKDKGVQGVEFVKQYGNGIPQILVDSEQMKEVFTNIILNGIEAMPEGGNLSITIETGTWPEVYTAASSRRQRFSRRPVYMNGDTDLISIQFSDTGVGIPKQDLEQLFDPFFTVKKGRASFGLAIAHKIVENHNGFIEVDSSPGNGTTFKVWLPVK